MRRIVITFFVALMLLSNVCFAASYELVYTDALNSQIYIDKDSVKPIQYKIWDCYRAATKIVFSQPMNGISYSVLTYLVNKDNKDYAVVFIENYDANNTLLSAMNKTDSIKWQGYAQTNDNFKLVDRIIEIAGAGK